MTVALIFKHKQDAIKEWTFKKYFPIKDSYLRVDFKHTGVDFLYYFKTNINHHGF